MTDGGKKDLFLLQYLNFYGVLSIASCISMYFLKPGYGYNKVVVIMEVAVIGYKNIVVAFIYIIIGKMLITTANR
jgi:hypothetical protein